MKVLLWIVVPLPEDGNDSGSEPSGGALVSARKLESLYPIPAGKWLVCHGLELL